LEDGDLIAVYFRVKIIADDLGVTLIFFGLTIIILLSFGVLVKLFRRIWWMKIGYFNSTQYSNRNKRKPIMAGRRVGRTESCCKNWKQSLENSYLVWYKTL